MLGVSLSPVVTVYPKKAAPLAPLQIPYNLQP